MSLVFEPKQALQSKMGRKTKKKKMKINNIFQLIILQSLISKFPTPLLKYLQYAQIIYNQIYQFNFNFTFIFSVSNLMNHIICNILITSLIVHNYKSCYKG